MGRPLFACSMYALHVVLGPPSGQRPCTQKVDRFRITITITPLLLPLVHGKRALVPSGPLPNTRLTRIDVGINVTAVRFHCSKAGATVE